MDHILKKDVEKQLQPVSCSAEQAGGNIKTVPVNTVSSENSLCRIISLMCVYMTMWLVNKDNKENFYYIITVN